MRLAAKINSEYKNAQILPAGLLAQQKGGVGPVRPNNSNNVNGVTGRKLIEG